jgi:hypothetical protein
MKRFIAAVALTPWVAYVALTFVADNEQARAFVEACLWFGTPVLVLTAALRAYDEGFRSGRSSLPNGTSQPPVDTTDLVLQSTQQGQRN